jgi:hypothetical protein
MSLTLHAKNTAKITNVAAINAFSKEANFMARSALPPRGKII